jgi:hypothetical protein
MLRTTILLIACLFVAAPPQAGGAGFWTCSDGAWVAVGRPSYPAPVKACGSRLYIPKTKAQCEDVGGLWGPAGIFPKPICKVPTRDGGRTCGDTEECEGMCVADLTPAERNQLSRMRVALTKLGHCTPYSPVFGCMAIVRKGRLTGLTCGD